MPTREDYSRITMKALVSARDIAEKTEKQRVSEPSEILRFLTRYGYFATPLSGGEPGEFTINEWLASEGRGKPTLQKEGVSVLMYFSGGHPGNERRGIKEQEGVIGVGRYLRKDQVLAIYDADLLSDFDLAMYLLHEGRHARHQSRHLGNLPPLDGDDAWHETNTWRMMLRCCEIVGGDVWGRAVFRETKKLRRRLATLDTPAPGPNQAVYSWGSGYDTSLDRVFGEAGNEYSQQCRKQLLALAGNVQYWSRSLKMPTDTLTHDIVQAHYAGV